MSKIAVLSKALSLASLLMMLSDHSSLAYGQGGPIVASNDKTLPMKDLDITRARPLQDALYSVEQRLHTSIGFEQGSPQDEGMIVPGDGSVGHLKKDKLYQKVESLHVHFADSETDPIAATNTILAAYDNGTPSHKFTLQKNGNTILVFPSNNSVSQLRIDLADVPRSLDQAAQAIADAIAKAVGLEVKIWTPPMGGFELFNLSAKSEPICDVLVRFTRLLGTSGSYWLIYDPTNNCYFLSLAFQRPAPVLMPRPTPPMGNATSLQSVPNSPYFRKNYYRPAE